MYFSNFGILFVCLKLQKPNTNGDNAPVEAIAEEAVINEEG